MKKSAVMLASILALSVMSVLGSSGKDLAQGLAGEEAIWHLSHQVVQPFYGADDRPYFEGQAADGSARGIAISVPIESDEHAAVKRAIEQSIGWAIEKDFDAMFRLWADDLFHFWLFSNSKVVGLEAMKKHAEGWRNPDFRGTRFEFKDLRIVFSRSGDVAWYSCFLDDCSSFKGEETCLKDVFQTGVLEKRDGRWVHVLMHGAYPIDKIPENYVRRFYSGLFEKKEGK